MKKPPQPKPFVVACLAVLWAGVESEAQQPSRDLASGRGPDSVVVETGDVHENIRAALRRPSKMGFMSRTLDEVQQSLQDSYEFNVYLDLRAIDAVGLGDDTPVVVETKVRPLAEALAIMLEPLEMTWTVYHESLVLTTREQAAFYLTTRLYDLSDLAPDPRGTRLVYSDNESPEVLDGFIDTIQTSLRPFEWEYGGGPGTIEEVRLDGRHLLAVRQTDIIHEEIGTLLRSLRQLPGPPTAERDRKKPQSNPRGIYTRVYPLLPSARSCAELERLIRLSCDEDGWQQQDTFVRGVANSVVVRHDSNVQRQVYEVLVGLNAISPKFKGSPFI